MGSTRLGPRRLGDTYLTQRLSFVDQRTALAIPMTMGIDTCPAPYSQVLQYLQVNLMLGFFCEITHTRVCVYIHQTKCHSNLRTLHHCSHRIPSLRNSSLAISVNTLMGHSMTGCFICLYQLYRHLSEEVVQLSQSQSHTKFAGVLGDV